MFGYLTARTDLLDEDRIKRYKPAIAGFAALYAAVTGREPR